MFSGFQTALIVDDDFDARKFVDGLLTTQMGFARVKQAQSPEVALEMLGEGEKFDIIFSGDEFSRMKGDEFLGEIRKNPETVKTPFIMMSIKKDKESLVAAIRAGVTNYLVKPLTAGPFMQKMKKTFTDIIRKEVERFNSGITNHAEIYLTGDKTLIGELVDVSDSDCVIRTPIIGRGVVYIYDLVDVGIKFEGSLFKVHGEIKKIEEDTVDTSIRYFNMLSIQFSDLDHKAKGKLERLVTSVHVQKVEAAKAQQGSKASSEPA